MSSNLGAGPSSSSQTSSPTATASASTAPPSSSRSGVHAALRYTGIPESWIRRPRLPSRNWLIFIGVTSSIVGAYAYDRRKCREIRDRYVHKVEHLAQVPLASMDLPRKVTVFAAKWPGDDDYTRGVRYFKKYVKPILVAAAVDYDIVNGKRLGDVTRTLEDRIIRKRRIAAGLEKPKQVLPLPFALTPAQEEQRELQGGSIIVGRQTFKEYMEGLRRGWSGGVSLRDREEEVVHALDGDAAFDEPDELDAPVGLSVDVDEEPLPTASRLSSSSKPFTTLTSPYSLKTNIQQESRRASSDTTLATIPAQPSTIPPQPPLLLVPFTNYLGFTQIPLMLYDFFTQRYHVQAGAELAYRIVSGHTRDMQHSVGNRLFEEPGPDDLNFDRASESYYKSSVDKLEATIGKEKQGFYKELPARLETARALARHTREPTKDEEKFPPPTEVELRSERLKKEVRWRSDLEGWKIIKPQSDVVWDERFHDVLKVFDVSPEEERESKTSDS